MDLFEKAVLFAAKAHEGKKRKIGDLPYIIHPLEVAVIAASVTEDREVLAACVLHDTVEDTQTTAAELEAEFGPRVAALVASETENKMPGIPKSESWMLRKEASLEVLKNSEDIGVKILWLSDKLANMRSFFRMYINEGAAMWQSFNQSDPAKHEYYYSKVREYTKELSHTDAWSEYSTLIDTVFKGEE